jgi:transposase-like protein
MRVVFYPFLLEPFVMSPTNSQDSRLKWQQRIETQKDSGLSVSQFCQQHGCSASSFYQWRRKLGSPSPKPATEISVPPALGVGALQQLIPKRPSGPVPSIDLVLPGGTIARVPADQLEALEIVLRFAQPATF